MTKSLTLLMQASYYIGYFPQEWKKESRISKKKTENFHQEKSYCLLSFSSIKGKIYEIILQEVRKVLEQINFSKNKNLYAC